MKLNLIYGKSGAGKSNFIYEDIKNNKDKKIYLIVPEQSNLSAEVKLLNQLDEDSLIEIEVLTLKRMAFRVINELFGEKKHLSNSQKNLIIYEALNKRKKELKFLNKNEKNIDIIIDTITELKKHNIKIDDIEKTKIEDTYTKLKMEDIKIIFKDYQEKIDNKFLDENDDLTILADNINRTKMFDNALVYFDEFNGFTPQEMSVFEKILLLSEQTTISICTDSLEIKNKENDIFYFNKIFANELIGFAISNSVPIEKKLINEDKKYKTEELNIIETNFRKGSMKVFSKEPENIELNLMDNPYAELEYIAQRIIMFAKKGYRYNKIAILTGNLEDYDINAKMIFEKHKIPLYLDTKKKLVENILVQYVLEILDIFANNWSFDSVIAHLKNGLQNIDENLIFEFENYCRQWGIQGNKFLKPFEFDKANSLQDQIEECRNNLITPLMDLKENILKSKTVKTITLNIYQFLLDNNILENLNNRIKDIEDIDLINQYGTGYKIFINILDDIVDLFGEEKIGFEKYKDYLTIAINSEELGTIPATKDQVILGEINRAKLDNIDICFIVGVNDGIFPLKIDSEGYFNDKDRQILSLNGIELAKNSIDAMFEDEFNIYKTLTVPRKKLIISYCSSNTLGDSLRPSIIIKRIKKFFPKIKEKNGVLFKEEVYGDENSIFENALQKYFSLMEGKEIDEEWKNIIAFYQKNEKERFDHRIFAASFNNIPEIINDSNIRKLYNKELKASISKLEEYQKCPFSYHMKYGLNLKEPKEFKIKVLDTGNFMHEVIDIFFTKLQENNIDIHTINDDEIKIIIDEIISELLQLSKYYIFTSMPKFRALTRRLKNVIYESISYIIYTLKNSKFEILGNEIEFGKNKEYSSIIIENGDGTKTELSGKIDRIDIGKIDNKEYLRIIDYKSSSKNLDLNKAINGLQIQLLTYIDSISKQRNALPGGILYMGLIENIVKCNKNKSDEEISDEIKKKFKMQGIIVADINIIKMMDTKLENGMNSDIIPAGLTSKGNINSKSSSTITKEEFERLQKKINQIVRQISKQILNGNIDIKPYKYNQETGCDFCPYKSICMFDTNMKNNKYNYISQQTKEEILNEIK